MIIDFDAQAACVSVRVTIRPTRNAIFVPQDGECPDRSEVGTDYWSALDQETLAEEISRTLDAYFHIQDDLYRVAGVELLADPSVRPRMVPEASDADAP